MPRSARPRKGYRPHPVRLDAHEHAVSLAAALTEDQRESLAKPMRTALDALRTGHGSWDAWRALADVGNVAEALASKGIAGNLTDKVQAGQRVLSDLAERVKGGRSWTLRGPELTALDDMVWLHEVQLQHATQGEVAHAVQRVVRVVRGVLTGGASSRAHVVVGALQS